MEQKPIELIPVGFYCFSVVKYDFVEGKAVLQVCPYLKFDEETKIKWCSLLNNIEIGEYKECQIKLME